MVFLLKNLYNLYLLGVGGYKLRGGAYMSCHVSPHPPQQKILYETLVSYYVLWFLIMRYEQQTIDCYMCAYIKS